MKKFSSFALALAFTGASAFADPALTTSVYVDSGLKAVTNKDGTTYQNYASDWDDTGVWATVGAKYATDKGGVEVVLDVTSETGVTTDTAYGWVAPLEGLKFYAGKGYAGTFDGLDDTSNDYFSSTGVSATYSLSGFTLGAGVVSAAVADDTVSAVFGAAYTFDKLVSLRASALTAAEKLDNLGVSASSNPIENLSLSAGYYAKDLATDKTDWIDASVGYQLTPAFGAAVLVYDQLTGEYFTIAPSVTYKATEALTLTGKVTIGTEGKTVAATYIPYVKAAYAVDANSTIWGYAQYDTQAETTTWAIDYLFNF